MSLENVDAVRAIYAEWAKGNFRAGVDLYDRLVLFIPLEDFPAAGYYLGKDGVREFMRGFLAAWTNLTMAAEDLIEAGDSVVVTTRWRGVGKESGVRTEKQVFDVWTFRGRAVTRVEFFPDRAEALEAVGLSEQTMSQENENFEVVRRFHDALNRRDVDAMVAVWDKDAEFRPIMSALDSQVYRGHDGLRAWLDAIFADWEVFEAYDDEFRDFGDSVLSFGHWHACGRASGVVLDIDTAAWLVRVREGKIVWWQTFTDRAEALEAVALSDRDVAGERGDRAALAGGPEPEDRGGARFLAGIL